MKMDMSTKRWMRIGLFGGGLSAVIFLLVIFDSLYKWGPQGLAQVMLYAAPGMLLSVVILLCFMRFGSSNKKT